MQLDMNAYSCINHACMYWILTVMEILEMSGIFKMSRPRNVMEIVKYDNRVIFLNAMSLK